MQPGGAAAADWLYPAAARGLGRAGQRPQVDTSEIQESFRRGIRGAAPPGAVAGGLAEAGAAYAAGPNEELLLGINRMPGLGDPHAAYETGRALRMIIRLFDQAGAPAIIGRQFIDNLTAAVMTSHMRRRALAWGAVDTADMFIEMYVRILGGAPGDHDQVRRTVIDYAVGVPGNAGERGLGALFRRRRAAGTA